MAYCFRCEKSMNSSELLECVHTYGIVHVCQSCYPKFKSPIIEKKKVNWDEVDTRSTVRQKLSNIAGVNIEEKRINVLKKKNPEDITLRDIVEKNFDKNKIVAKENHTDLIDNFHWAVMRKRRAMKVTILELSEKISEPESVLISLEKGILPKDYSSLIRKIESFLGISIHKENKKEIKTEDILAESKIPTGILLSDIKEKSNGFMNWFKKKPIIKIDEKEEIIDANDLNLEKVEEIFGKPLEEDFEIKKSDFSSKKEKIKEEILEKNEEIQNDDLTQEEIDRLIWRS